MPLSLPEIAVKKDKVLVLTKRLTVLQHEMDLILDTAFENIQTANERIRILGKQREIMSIVNEIDGLTKQEFVLVFLPRTHAAS